MRKAGVLFAIISLVGAHVVLGQFGTGNPTTTNSSVGIGTVTTSAKLHVFTSAGYSGLFMGGNVGIGTVTPTELLNIKDGNVFIQKGTLRVWSTSTTSDALLVSGGLARLEGGLYVGTEGLGNFNKMTFDGTGVFGIKTNLTSNTYDLGISALLNGANVSSPVISTTTNMVFRTNSALGANATHFRFLSGSTELARLSSNGFLGIGTTAPAYGLDLNTPSTNADAWILNRARMSELVLGGVGKTNHWIFHRPDDGRTSLYIAPVTSGKSDYNWGSGFEFKNDGTLSIKNLMVNSNIGIGLSASPTEKLHIKGNIKVEGKIAAIEVCVNPTATWCDYVFEPDYRLMPLKQLQSFIQTNKHLPEIPSSAEVEKDGISLSKMVTLQMKKIEEMTLYILELEARMKKLEHKQ